LLLLALLAAGNGCTSREEKARAKFIQATESLKAAQSKNPDVLLPCARSAQKTLQDIIKEYPTTETAIKSQAEVDRVSSLIKTTEEQVREALPYTLGPYAAKAWPVHTNMPAQIKDIMDAEMRTNQTLKADYDKLEALMPGALKGAVAQVQAQLNMRYFNEQMAREEQQRQQAQYDAMRKAYAESERKAREAQLAFAKDVQTLRTNTNEFETRANAVMNQLKEQALAAGRKALVNSQGKSPDSRLLDMQSAVYQAIQNPKTTPEIQKLSQASYAGWSKRINAAVAEVQGRLKAEMKS
jgi:hypothetical protein